MKGVLLAGGTGSRLHPLTRITNKHLLPIYDRPMIQWAIEALVKAGVTELMLVTGGTHAGEFLRLLGNGHEFGIDRLCYAYQESPGGIAEALGLAERFCDGEPVLGHAGRQRGRAVVPTDGRGVRRAAGRCRGSCSPRSTEPEHLRHLGVPELDAEGRVDAHRREAGGPAEPVRRDRHLLLRRRRVRRHRHPRPSGRGELEITDVNNHYVDARRDGLRRARGVLG